MNKICRSILKYMKIYFEKADPVLNSTQLHDAAYALLLRALRTDWGLHDIRIEKTPAGKPYIADEPVHISISHTKGFVCCAVSEKPCGIDCEYRRTVSESTMRRVCTETELLDIRAADDLCARFMVYWTLKESISKKRGVGLKESFKQYEITFRDGVPVCAGHTLYTEKIDGFFLAAAE